MDNSLEGEVDNIKTYQQRMQKMLAKVNSFFYQKKQQLYLSFFFR